MPRLEPIENLPSPSSGFGGVFSSGLLVQKAFGSMRKQIRATISKVRCELQSKILARLHKATGRFASESVLYPLPPSLRAQAVYFVGVIGFLRRKILQTNGLMVKIF